MRSQHRILFFICTAATIVTRRTTSPRALAFQPASPLFSRPSSSSSPSSISRRRDFHRGRLGTASKESTDTANDEIRDDDGDRAAGDSRALRQLTFLGLAAPDDGDGDGEESPKAALDARGLSEFLMEIGASSVSITDSDADTEEEDPLFDEPRSDESWAMAIPDLAAGRNLWRRCDVSAHLPASLDVPSVVDAVTCTFALPARLRYEVDDVPDLDWVRRVQESWGPIVTGESKFVLRFPWHEDRAVMRACQEAETAKMRESMRRKFSSGVKREGAVVHFENDGEVDQGSKEAVESWKKNREYVQIRLEGGIAFGTGEHPTTRLCLDWVRDKVEQRLHDTDDESLRFLDYGAGSGVLGIAAACVVRHHNSQPQRHRERQPYIAKKSITAVGVEIDADSIRTADDNSRENGVDMSNHLPDLDSLDAEALSVVMRAMQRRINAGIIRPLPEELDGPIYDLCAANILADPLVNLAPTIASLMKSPGGEIGLSGILSTKAQSVVGAYAEYFGDLKVAGEENGWVLITGRRK